MSASQIIKNIVDLVVAYWPLIVATIGSAVIASGLLEGIKRAFVRFSKENTELTRLGVNTSLYILTFLGSAIEYKFQLVSDAHPVAFLGISTVVIAQLARHAYSMFVKSFSAYTSKTLEDAKAYRSAVSPVTTETTEEFA